jgi:threonine/homoserine efflux transporter RhtA
MFLIPTKVQFCMHKSGKYVGKQYSTGTQTQGLGMVIAPLSLLPIGVFA